MCAISPEFATERSEQLSAKISIMKCPFLDGLIGVEKD
jgi:hypothetical protein